MKTPWFTLGSALLAVAVAAGALGAHFLRGRLDAPSLSLWETAVRYLVVAGAGLLAVGLADDRQPRAGWTAAGACLAVGAVIFSGTVGGLALGGPRWLGAVTPLGGVLLIAGFAVSAATAFRRRV
ncbi:MAG TPA: DUF423 domain-containing protein [Thermoanaerobaculaceae bacterium]|nr:DUF423 domain-containing protein [Thermoanaerobaculaceae bacterium]